MSHDEFTKLYNYLQQEFTAVRQEIKHVDDKVNHVYGLMDSFIKRHEIQEQERLLSKVSLTAKTLGSTS